MTKFKPYPSYKDSGVEWLGDVPEGWEIKALKYLVNCLDSKRIPLNGEQRAEKQGDVPYWGANAIMDYVDEAIFDEDLILLGEDGAPFLDPFKPVAFHSSGPIWPNNHIHVLRPNKLESIRYLVHALNTVDYSDFIEGSTRQKLTQSRMMGIPLSWPSELEQKQIARFLDYETARMDKLIEEQERLIELLEEKRQALISHAVTKGLDPTVPMKDSGVEWLGEVPAGWRISALKWLSPVSRGASPRPIDDPIYFDDDGEYAWVRISDVTAATDGFLNETTQRLSRLGASLSVKLEPNELFLSIAGSVGKPCITKIKACIHDGFVYFPSLTIDHRFLYRVFEAGLCFGGLGKMGTQLNLNTDTVGGIYIAIPPTDELDDILLFLDRETALIDDLIKEAERGIDLLQERRSALISAAVTGKIDVRGWRPPASADAKILEGSEALEAEIAEVL